jgi:hypothetical protein
MWVTLIAIATAAGISLSVASLAFQLDKERAALGNSERTQTGAVISPAARPEPQG